MKKKKKTHQHKTALQTLFMLNESRPLTFKTTAKQRRTDLKQDINLLDKGDCVCMSR